MIMYFNNNNNNFNLDMLKELAISLVIGSAITGTIKLFVYFLLMFFTVFCNISFSDFTMAIYSATFYILDKVVINSLFLAVTTFLLYLLGILCKKMD